MKRRWWWLVLGALLLGAGLCYWQPWQTRLQVIRKGGEGPPDFMLLHGYGATAEQWLPFVKTIAWPAPARFLFPEAPETFGRPDRLGVGRAWWDLDLAAHLRPGKFWA